MVRHVLLMLCCAAGTLLVACAKKPEPVAPAPTSACEAIFVLAPAGYTLFTSADLVPLLASEGQEQDLPVFCTAGNALEAMRELEAAKELPPGFWQIFRLEGNWESEVVQTESGAFRMRHPATLSYHPGDNLADRI